MGDDNKNVTEEDVAGVGGNPTEVTSRVEYIHRFKQAGWEVKTEFGGKKQGWFYRILELPDIRCYEEMMPPSEADGPQYRRWVRGEIVLWARYPKKTGVLEYRGASWSRLIPDRGSATEPNPVNYPCLVVVPGDTSREWVFPAVISDEEFETAVTKKDGNPAFSV